jgi:hypothetical protein
VSAFLVVDDVHSHISSVVCFCFSGCKGTSRLLGAGHVTRKDGANFGPPKPESGLTRTMPKTSTEMKHTDLFAYTDRRKGTVPAKDERPILGITTSKNFVTANAVEAILMSK